jgi:predicted permease
VESQKTYVEQAIEQLRQTPGVVAAAAVTQPPFDTEGAGSRLAIELEGETYAPGTNPDVRYRTASREYFDTIGMTVRRGRGFGPDDREGAPLVLVVNESMAARHWPGEDPVGKRLTFADGRDAGWHTVIGVVNDVATDGLESDEGPTVYAPNAQRSLVFLRWMTLVVRTEREVDAELATIRASVQSVDPNQPIYAVSTMGAVVARSVAERRFALTLMAGFGGLTLVLAAIGLYGALAQSVSDRTRDIGVRLAIGAEPAAVFRLVVAEGLRVVAAGLALGVGLAALASRQVESLLFGVAPLDPVTYVAMVVVLGGVGLAACVIPARRASWVDPVRALRSE